MTDQDKSALLSKLRAPVADERADFNAWLKTQRNPDDMNKAELVAAWEAWQERGRRAALASAPVAGEAQPVAWRWRPVMALSSDWIITANAADAAIARRWGLDFESLYAAPQASASKPVWSHCVFHGTPPTGFANWIEWLAAPVKKGVFVRAATAEDLKNLPPPSSSEAVRDAGIAASEDVAPWTDFAGNPIKHGDRIRHPEGLEGVVVRLPGYADAHDAWCVAYQDRTVSRLSLQIGHRGQAVVQGALSAQPGAQNGGSDGSR